MLHTHPNKTLGDGHSVFRDQLLECYEKASLDSHPAGDGCGARWLLADMKRRLVV